MTTVISGLVTSGQTATPSDPVIVSQSGTIDASSFSIVIETGANAVVAGTATGIGSSVYMFDDSRLYVAQSGLLAATDSNSADGIDAESNASITIAGTVIANDVGIYTTSDGFDIEITSSGLLIGGSDNDGADAGSYSAALGLIGSGRVVNHGTLIGEFNPNTGRSIALGNDYVEADGGAFVSTGDYDLTFVNTGLVEGDMIFSAGDDTYLARGTGFVYGRVYMGSGEDTYAGGSLDDTVALGGGSDTARGRQGDDTLKGDGGNDLLRGNDGDDVLLGGGGADRLIGGRGDDTLIGGAQADTFVFRGAFGSDTIRGFSTRAAEKIDLSGVHGIKNWKDLKNNHLSSDGKDALISVGDDEILLVGTGAGKLEANDFLF